MDQTVLPYRVKNDLNLPVSGQGIYDDCHIIAYRFQKEGAGGSVVLHREALIQQRDNTLQHLRR
jgi:hypothetical protein